MSKDNEGMPFVPEEDLNLHENFAPIIAEDGVIGPSEEKREEIPVPDAWTTRMDTVQDLVALRSAQEKEKPKEEKPKEGQPSSQAALPSLQEEKITPLPPEKENKESQQPPQTEDKKEVLPPQEESRPREVVEQNAPSPKDRKKKSKKERRQVRLSQKIKALLKKQPLQLPCSSQKPTPAPKKPRRWPWVVAVLCFLFLGTITGVVPVEKIPLLRNLAYAMGFTKADTARMSFLRALLTWTDKTVGFSSSPEEGRSSLWARLFGADTPNDEREDLAGLQARLERAGGKTSLIDIQALNALQRQKGRALDEIKNSALVNPGSEQGQDPAAMRDTNVSVHTEANQDKSDVFFGSDATAAMRNFQDGYDSVNTLKKLANPYIANGTPIDWLQNTAQRMMRSDVGLGGVNRGLQGTQVNWGNNTGGIGDGKPQKDLYFAWITSRMAQKTPNLMLKKALVDTGFMGADFPTMASNVVGYGGIQIDMASFQEDQEAWREYLEWEKKCKAEINDGGGKIVNEAVSTFNDMFTIQGGTGRAGLTQLSFPQTCEAVKTSGCDSYKTNLNTIQSACSSAQKGYKRLETSCSMVNPPSNCSSERIQVLAGRCDSFKARCDECAQARANAAANGQPVPEGCKEGEEKWEDAQGHDQKETEEAVLAVVGGDTDYFPQIVRSKDDQEGIDRAQQSITGGMSHTAALMSPF